MEVFQTDHHYIFVKKERSLWWNRTTSEFSVKAGWDLSSVDDIECIGITHGIIGVTSLPGVYEPHLIVIRESTPVGVLYPPNLVYKIKSICLLSDGDPDALLSPCPRHNGGRKLGTAITERSSPPPPTTKTRLFESSQLVNKTWGAVKSAGSTIKNTTQQAAVLAHNQMKSTVGIRDPNRVEKRINEELHKIFDDTDSFYYCIESDITNNLQRRADGQEDERFFWNKHMIQKILDFPDQLWALPIIQGFVQVEQCVIGNECFTLSLVSRRSRHRAGTRYKRRGVDEDGHVANYVETEQILSFRAHQMAFTQVRGSVPVFWSQPGYKYRPPPRIDRDESETQQAFEKHFNREVGLYSSICIINLIEQSGKEKVIGDSYANYIIKYNSDNLIYVTFDFHDYCRGMRFENVSALIEALAPEASAMGFHWRDAKGPICNQKSVFRVNCMDCLDRTNVVQTAIGKTVLESQLVKLGLAPPYSPIPEQLKAPFMVLWANNGDIISRQYAGTNALKGDYTRTGERKISGIMKDGMNSANRYIIQHFADTFRQCVIDLVQGHLIDSDCLQEDDLFDTVLGVAQTALVPSVPPPTSGYFNGGALSGELHLAEALIGIGSYYLARFKDTYRQATIDLMLGNNVSAESLNALGGQVAPDENDALEGAEHARLLVEDCRRLLLGSAQYPVGAWGLIDFDPTTGDPNETEVDSILLLTDDCYMVADYDSHLDKIIRFEKVFLTNITMIELGLFQQTKMFQGAAQPHLCIRINYAVDSIDGYFHMFRSPNIRFFNNVAVAIKTQEEVMASLTAIVEIFRISLENLERTDVKFLCGGTLQRRKSRTPMLDVPKGIPRNLSESQLVQIGSKALSNVAGQFSKLGQSLNPVKMRSSGGKSAKTPHISYNPTSSLDRDDSTEGAAKFTVGGTKKPGHESSSDSEDNECSIFEPDIVQENPIYNENAFLPSVGIVMSTNDPTPVNQLVNKDNMAKLSEDVSTVSISSVTDHVLLQSGMLDNTGSPIRAVSPNPEIRIQSIGDEEQFASSSKQYSTSAAEMRINNDSSSGSRTPLPRDMTLNLSGSQSENALKQLKNLTSPLSKLAKGMQTIGMNLDPRKMTAKTPVQTEEQMASTSAAETAKLQERWDNSHCQTKLIAL